MVTVFAAALGLSPDSGGGTDPKRKRSALVIATIAAVGTVLTGASGRLGDQAETARGEAIQMRDVLIQAHADIAAADSDDDVRRILERLRTVEL